MQFHADDSNRRRHSVPAGIVYAVNRQAKAGSITRACAPRRPRTSGLESRRSPRVPYDGLSLPPPAAVRPPLSTPFALGLLCVIVTTAIQLLSPWVLKYAIDDLNARRHARASSRIYAALLLGIALVGGDLPLPDAPHPDRRVARHRVRPAQRFLRAPAAGMPLAYFQARRTGDLMSRATNDLNAVRMMIGPAVMYSANTIIVFVVAIVLMFSIDARLTLHRACCRCRSSRVA